MIPLFVKKGLLHYCNGIIFKAKLPDPINRSEKQKHTCTLRMRARWQVSANYAHINQHTLSPAIRGGGGDEVAATAAWTDAPLEAARQAFSVPDSDGCGDKGGRPGRHTSSPPRARRGMG